MSKTALMVVDVQTALVEEKPFNISGLLDNIRRLERTARDGGIEVIFVQHDGGPGDEVEAHTPGWEFERSIAPKAHEKVFNKRFNSAFRQTHLAEYLEDNGIQTLFLVGLQTEYCIDATCKVAFELGFNVIIPEGGTSTFDNDFLSGEKLLHFYERRIWNGRFARVLPFSEAIGELLENTTQTE